MKRPNEQDSNLVDHVRRNQDKGSNGEKGWNRYALRTVAVLVAAGLALTVGGGIASAAPGDSTVTANGTHGGRWRVETFDGTPLGPWRTDRAVFHFGDGRGIHVQGPATCRSDDADGFTTGVLTGEGVDDAWCYGWAV